MTSATGTPYSRPDCDLCEGRGYRTDSVGIFYVRDELRDPDTGEGGSDTCEGTGSIEPPDPQHYFEAEHAADVAAFLRASGGLRIESRTRRDDESVACHNPLGDAVRAGARLHWRADPGPSSARSSLRLTGTFQR
ncbi:hypothetical protein [Streptomyces sp. AS02]|uniref:hypothetical protein n=1 Tax=Streptomyces sp. AS02 TaxID=2938946 RepID=UPI00202252CF|nr:hypothetical protein [Streptomyces sp. AS02]MCL8014929.1 hypothetical protein [Streptomyces sp. AS02]